MKLLSQLTLLGTLLVAISCSENESLQSGEAQFSFEQLAIKNGRIMNEAKSVLVTVKRHDGSPAYSRKKLALYHFGQDFISEPLALMLGQYNLTEFFVLNDQDEVIYASPLEGSELAYLVNDPLPMGFSISINETIKVTPEVLAIENNVAVDFGYSTFSFDIVQTFTFSVSAFVYSEESQNFELTSASITVWGNDTTLYSGQLNAATNNIRLKNQEDSTYTIIVSKDGYSAYTATFSENELKAYTGENILIVTLDAGTEIVNRALSFDGSYDYVDLGNVYDSVALPISIAAWIWVDEGETYYPIFTSQDVDNIYNGFTFQITYSHVAAGFGDGRGENNSYFRRNKSALHNGDIFGKWVHVAAVIKGATDMDVYIDGVDAGGIYTGNSPYPMDSNFPNAFARIGSVYSNDLIIHYKGMMDELNIWNRSLSATEVDELRTKKLTGDETGLIGYWNFDEADGDTVFDKSSNHFNGVIHGDTKRILSGTPELH